MPIGYCNHSVGSGRRHCVLCVYLCVCVCVCICVCALLNMPMGKNTVAAGKGSAKMKKRERNRTAENGKPRRREDRCPFWIVLTCSVIILRQSNPVPNPIASQE